MYQVSVAALTDFMYKIPRLTAAGFLLLAAGSSSVTSSKQPKDAECWN
jgi:hypothetical protein